MTEFAELSRRSQIQRLRAAADRVLADYGITDAELRLKQWDFNATYRVDTGGHRFALRINVNSPHGAEAVTAEAAWVEAIATDTDLRVPRPIRTRDGDVAATARVDGLDRDLGAVLYSWLPGRDVGEEAPRVRLRAMGAAMATLHDHTRSWSHPSTAARPRLTGVWMDETDRVTTEERWIPKKARGPIHDAVDQIAELTAPLWRRKRQLIHGDLHIWNAKWHEGRLSLFDFDDCGHGLALQDLAITSYYLRDDEGAEAALRDGYTSVRALPEHTDEQFEALLAGRNLLLLNSVLESVNADMADFLPGYVEKTAGRMKAY
ncbi:MAG: phosphotransferase, partial [Planctomycetota bacterium]